MNLFSIFSSSDKALEIVAKGEDLVDKSFFTSQEKSEVGLKYAEICLRTMETTANESSIRSITRRVLACGIMGVFLCLLLSSVLIWPFNTAYADYIMGIAKTLSPLAGGIGVFYFGYYGVSQAFKSIKGGK